MGSQAMTRQKWQIFSGLALVIGAVFLVWAFTSGTPTLYAAAAIWFVVAAILGRKAAR